MTTSAQLSNAERHAVVTAMRAIIADISERNYAAGWYLGIEEVLWRQLRNPTREWLGYSSDNDLLPTLRVLSELIGGWVSYDTGYVSREALERKGSQPV